MGELWEPLLVVSCIGAVLAGVHRIAMRARRRGISGSVLGLFDELFHPAAHRSQIEVAEQKERRAPQGSPDDL